MVKRIDGGEELSEADLDALIEEALAEAGVEDKDVEIIVKKHVRKKADDEE